VQYCNVYVLNIFLFCYYFANVNCIFVGFVEFGPEIAGKDHKTKLFLSSEDLVRLCSTYVCCSFCLIPLAFV